MVATQPEVRRDLYQRFGRRNRLVGRLRIIVPVLAVVFVSIPLGQMLVSALAQSFSIGGIRLESDTLVVDSPRFEGRTASGDNYVMVAERAESRVGDLDTVELFNLDLDLTGDADYAATAFLVRGSWTLSTEQLISNEDVRITDSTGARGYLAGVEVDWPGQIVTSEGPVRFEFVTGNQLTALQMRYEIEEAHWRFTDVRLGMIPTADLGAERSIEDYVLPEGSTEPPSPEVQ